tara:strand:- start:764 stop:1114 length:351 start_codon:yes stop_codon:yes gene_type:complete
MEQQVNADLILNTFEEWVTNKREISPTMWVDGAMKLNIFIGDENARLYNLEKVIATKKAELIQEPKMSVAKANVICEALDEYEQMQNQKGRIEQIKEFIRLAKKQATLIIEEIKGY